VCGGSVGKKVRRIVELGHREEYGATTLAFGPQGGA
jgi:hypothetical protein